MEQTFELKQEHLQDYRHYVHWVLGRTNLLAQIVANVLLSGALVFFGNRYEGNPKNIILGLAAASFLTALYLAYAWRFVRTSPRKAKLQMDAHGLTYRIGTESEHFDWVAVQRVEHHRNITMLRLPDEGRRKHAILLPRQEEEWEEFVQARLAGLPLAAVPDSPESSGEEE